MEQSAIYRTAISIIILCAAFFTSESVAQRTSAKDSVAASRLSAQTGIPYEKTKKLVQAMTWRQADMEKVDARFGLSRIKQQALLKAIFFERRIKMDSLLSSDERSVWLQKLESARLKQNAADSLMLRQQDDQMLQAGGQRAINPK